MTITIVGHGYVGLVTACVFADLGNTVYVIGRNNEKIKKLQSGDPIIFEPGLAELLKKNLSAQRISFTTSYEQAIPESETVFIAVGTPPKENGEADLSSVLAVAENIGRNLKKNNTVISCKSTVPIGTNRKIYELVQKLKPEGVSVQIASCPEFLKEGSALTDTFEPDRIVIGTDSDNARDALLKLHEPLPGERVLVGIESAEIIKYASNSILATKISFANLISFICEKAGANVEEVLDGVGLDQRIGRIFLYPGVGYGGSCFPKDVKALIQTGKSMQIDMSLLESVEKINKHARENILEKIMKHAASKKVALWGIAFKPNTDDIRDAPSVYIIEKLLNEGFEVVVYDPEALDNVKQVFGNKISYADGPYKAAESADTLVVLTEWNEFKQINLDKIKSTMKTPLIIDGRNVYDPSEMKEKGFTYISVGR